MRVNWIMARPNLTGGVKSSRLIAEALARRGHDVVIYYCAAPRPWPRIWRARSFAKRLHRELFEGLGRRHHLERAAIPLVAIHEDPIPSHRVRDADIVVTSWWEVTNHVFGWPSTKGLKIYYIRHHELHGGDPDRVAATYRLPVQKVVIARWLERLVRERYCDSTVVTIPNGVDWNQFDSSPRRKTRRGRVGFLFGKDRWKGAHTAFAALKRVAGQHPGLQVVSFGSSAPEHVPLANFEFHLRPEQHAISAIYRSTDCWIVPSTSEGLGMPGLEAAASHCPLVVTRSGGPEDYVEHGRNGFLVPVEDPDAMAEAVRAVLTASDAGWESMSAASYEIAHRFDWDRSAAQLETLFLGLLERENRNRVAARA